METSQLGGGFASPGFEDVHEAFEENFRSRGDVGASVALYVDGVEKVHLWKGTRRPGHPWGPDTLVCGFSTVKPILATAIGILADRGELDLYAPIARVWPEFAANGKARATPAHVLTHTAGLPWFARYEQVVSFDEPKLFGAVDRITSALAAAEPQWEPGTQVGTHSISIGWLTAEIVRRVTGTTMGSFVRKEICDPLGIECWIGLPPSEHSRAADMIPDPDYDSDAVAAFLNPQTPMGKALFLGPKYRMGSALSRATNDPEYRTYENPAANGFTSARSLARFYAAMAAGGEIDDARLVSRAMANELTTVVDTGEDVVFGGTRRLGLGFMRPSPVAPFAPSAEAFGMPGQGGQLAFGDASRRLGFAYIPNFGVFSAGEDERARALVDAAYASIS